MLDILGRISTLASWMIYSWNSSSVQIGIEANVFGSFLHGYAALAHSPVESDRTLL